MSGPAGVARGTPPSGTPRSASGRDSTTPRLARAAVQVADRVIEMWQLPVPEVLQPGETLLRVEGNGLCGTDYEQFVGNLARGGLTEYPVVLGHEPVGWIAAISAEAAASTGLDVGARVVVDGVAACGVCGSCLSGRGRCTRSFHYSLVPLSVGPGLWGGLAEYMVLRPNTMMHVVPDDMTLEDASFFNALSAGYEGMCRVAGTGVGDTVVILGPGQRGLACVIAARAAGAERVIVTGLQRDATKLELALALGATEVINVESTPVIEHVRDLTGGAMADRVIDVTAGSPAAASQAVRLAAPGGTVVMAGVKAMQPIPDFQSDLVVLNSLTIRGAFGTSPWSTSMALRAMARGEVDLRGLRTHTFRLADVAAALQVLGGETSERAVHITVRVAD